MVMLRYEEIQYDDIKAGFGQYVTSSNSINYFKFLLQNAFCSSRKETQRDETVSWNKFETHQIGQHYFV